MTNKEHSNEILLRDLIDYVFPYDKLYKWSCEIRAENPRPPIDIMGKVAHITTNENFWGKNPMLWAEPLTINRPSDGCKINLIENGIFYTSRLKNLEDKELDQAILKAGPNLRPEIPWGQVNTTMRFATLLIGIITEDCHLPANQVIEVAKLHCVYRVSKDYPKIAGTPEDQAILLYACTKIVAQKIERGETRSAYRVDVYPS